MQRGLKPAIDVWLLPPIQVYLYVSLPLYMQF